MEGGQAISHRLVGALLLVKLEPPALLSELCKGHSQGFVLALRASGLPAAGQGKSRVLTVKERLNDYRREKGGIKKEQRIKRKSSRYICCQLLKNLNAAGKHSSFKYTFGPFNHNVVKHLS